MIQPVQLRKFAFLDSYRGLSAVFVICLHAEGIFGKPTTTFDGFYTGVPAFFQLSAFLLSYRLMVQFESKCSCHHSRCKCTSEIVLKYAVTRFCRIYLSFLIFLIVHFVLQWLSLLPANGPVQQLINGVLLRRSLLALDPSLYHLWTIPIEVEQ